MKSPPESLRTINPELYEWLDQLWKYINFVTPVTFKEEVADETYLELPSSVQGFGFVVAGNYEESAFFGNTDAAVVTLIDNSANCVNTDTDAKLCIIDGGTAVHVKNRLGATKEILVVYYYYP